MLFYLVFAIVCITIGAYGMLIVVGLCSVSASAGRQEVVAPRYVDRTSPVANICPICKKTILDDSESTPIDTAPDVTQVEYRTLGHICAGSPDIAIRSKNLG